MEVNGYKIEPGANLSAANLTDADLTDADLTDADLTDADLFGANLTRAKLTGANLFRANLNGTNLSGANLTRAKLTAGYRTRTNAPYPDMTRYLLWIKSRDLLSGANLVEAESQSPRPDDAIGWRPDLTAANLAGVDLTNANLSGGTMPDGSIHD